MTMSAALAVRKSVRATLVGDAALVSILGGANVVDEAPRGVAIGPNVVEG